MPAYRVTVNLNKFFSDYRSTCRIFINKNISTVGELIQYIGFRFNIARSFYLTCDNIYLPDFEDIRVIKEDDRISAIVSNDLQTKDDTVNHTSTPIGQIKHKKRKRRRSESQVIPSTCENPVSSMVEPNNIKESHIEEVSVVDYDHISSVATSPVKLKVKKSKKALKKLTKNVSEDVLDFEVNSDKSSLKEKESHQNHVIDFVSPYSCISNFKVPRKRPIKLMEISRIPKVIQTIHVQDKPPPTTNFVEDNIELSLSYDNASNTAADAIILNKPMQVDNVESDSHLTVLNNISVQEIVMKDSNEQHNDTNMTIFQNKEPVEEGEHVEVVNYEQKNEDHSTNRLQQAKQLLLQQIKERFKNVSNVNNKLMTSTTNSSCKSNSEDTETLTDCQQIDDAGIPIIKRKRKRVRRKKKTQASICSDFEIGNTQPYVPSPSDCSRKNSSTHVRFDDESLKEVVNGSEHDNDATKTPNTYNEHVKTDQERTPLLLPIVGSNERLRTEDIIKYPILTDKLPKEGDIIAFKLLVMSKSYTPEVSDYIIGHVLSYEPTGNNIQVKILEGSEQCELPEGKFLVKEYVEEQEKDERKLNLNQLLELRLLYP